VIDCVSGEISEADAQPSPPLVPAAVSNRQARLALIGGGLLDAANAALEALPSPEKELAQTEWEYATEIRRDSPLVSGIGTALELDDEAIDALFVVAAEL
jgi:hypothetical protein